MYWNLTLITLQKKWQKSLGKGAFFCTQISFLQGIVSCMRHYQCFAWARPHCTHGGSPICPQENHQSKAWKILTSLCWYLCSLLLYDPFLWLMQWQQNLCVVASMELRWDGGESAWHACTNRQQESLGASITELLSPSKCLKGRIDVPYILT